MKRIFSVMLVLTISWTTFFIVGSEAFASGLVETKPVPSTTVTNPSVTSSQSQSMADDLINWVGRPLEFEAKAALAYYFNVLLNDSYGVSASGYPSIRYSGDNYYTCTSVTSDAKPIRATSSNGSLLNCFNPDYLYDYFIVLCETAEQYDADSAGFVKTFALENGYTSNYLGASVFSAAIRPILALKVLSSDSDTFYYEPFSNYYNTLYAKYLSQNGKSSVSVGYENNNPETYIQPIKIPSESFVNAINNNTTSVIPSLQTFDRSWANNPLSSSSYDSRRTSMFFTFIENGNYFGIKDCRDIYGIPYITYEGIKYYYPYLCHFSFTNKTSANSAETDELYPCVDVSLCMKVSDTEPTRYYSNRVTTYAIFYNAGAGNSSFAQGCNAEYYCTAFSSGSSSTYPFAFSSSFSPFYKGTFFSSSNIVDSIDSYDFFRCDHGIERPSFTGSVSDKSYNYGFELSTKPFYLGALSSFLDGSLIPDNSYITISGDSVYDYSITNSTTGDTTNLGDFVNNGYAWLNTGSGTQNNGGGSGSGGGVGGNVTVGGQIDVGGSVDINVNVNDGNGGNINAPALPDNADAYISEVIEESGGVRQFLALFFNFLPAEILGLLGASVVVALWLRIGKR